MIQASKNVGRVMKSSKQCVISFVFLLPLPVFSQETPQGASFFDDFETLDKSLWGISDGWANGDWQNCVWSGDNVAVKEGMLTLAFTGWTGDQRDYSCGEIQSLNVYGYGTYEARYRTAAGSGLNAAFFTYIGPYHGKPHDEIDFEVLARDTSSVSLNTYVDGTPMNGKQVALPMPADDAFLTYSFVWQPTGIKWYVDGELVHQTPPEAVLPTNGQKIYASFWGSDSFPDWMGRFVEPETDLKMEVDWIAFTAQGDSCQFPSSVVCKNE